MNKYLKVLLIGLLLIVTIAGAVSAITELGVDRTITTTTFVNTSTNITSVNGGDPYIYNGSDVGDILLRFNESYLYTFTDDRYNDTISSQPNVSINTTNAGWIGFTKNVSVLDQFLGNLSWNYLMDYPVACPAGTAITQLDDSVTCTAFIQDAPQVNFTGNVSYQLNQNPKEDKFYAGGVITKLM